MYCYHQQVQAWQLSQPFPLYEKKTSLKDLIVHLSLVPLRPWSWGPQGKVLLLRFEVIQRSLYGENIIARLA